MPSRERIPSGFLLPAEIEVAQRAFDELCSVRGIKSSSDEAAELAATIIALFQQGVTSRDDLVAEFGNIGVSGNLVAAA